MQLSQQEKSFSELLPPLFETTLNFEHFQKKMTLIADIVSKLGTPKNMINKSLNSPVSEDPSGSNM